jgi:hypothetical protein
METCRTEDRRRYGAVSSLEVTQPVAVRLAWKEWPDYSLANGAGLPALPFRADDWPVVLVTK